MTTLKLRSPFNAPIYHEETVSSTMDVSRSLASAGGIHGTVVAADFQQQGRGRIRGRSWQMEKGANLPFTILLRYPSAEAIPAALTLRVGLAVSLAIEDFAPSLQGQVLIKWPNDIYIGSKKAAGILCEADGGNVHAGIGINVSQKDFPAPLCEKATSIALASHTDIPPGERFALLEKILSRLFDELETTAGAKTWKPRLEQRLYKKNEQVVFIEGPANSGKKVTGILVGIADSGELLIVPDGGKETRSFTTGELSTMNNYQLSMTNYQ